MSYTSTKLFPTWYKKITPQVTAELVTLRVNAINELIKNDDINFWLDVIRMAYERPILDKKSRESIVEEFHKEDINFELISNDNLVRVLSGITLCFKIEDADFEENFAICLAVTNFNSLGQYKESEVPFREKAEQFLAETKNNLDEQELEKDLEVLTETLESFEEEENEKEEEIPLNRSNYISILKTIKTLNSERARLAEELNSLWWLMGEHSKFYNDFFSNKGSVAMVIPSAYELQQLTTFSQEIKSGRALLHKVLTLSNKSKAPKDISVLEAINAIPKEQRPKLLSDTSNVSEFTPCLLALKTAIEIKNTVWPDTYAATSSNADIKSKKAQSEIAFQFYRELIFISII